MWCEPHPATCKLCDLGQGYNALTCQKCHFNSSVGNQIKQKGTAHTARHRVSSMRELVCTPASNARIMGLIIGDTPPISLHLSGLLKCFTRFRNQRTLLWSGNNTPKKGEDPENIFGGSQQNTRSSLLILKVNNFRKEEKLLVLNIQAFLKKHK